MGGSKVTAGAASCPQRGSPKQGCLSPRCGRTPELLTVAHPQTDTPEEVIAGQRLSVPDRQLQADVLQVLGVDAVVDKGVVVMRVQGLLHHGRLPLGGFVFVWQEVAGESSPLG